jgi:pimeloyl-ACP methyl ester carboxylesterase
MAGILGWVLLLLVGGAIALFLLGRILFAASPQPDQIHFVETGDFRTISIWRYLPRGDEPKKTPVILQHGLGVDQFNLDMNERVSLARYLAGQGYDVFLPGLRGCGLSKPRRWSIQDKWHIRFEFFVERDLPAAIERVAELTGRKRFHYVGHSMGGMVGYALAEGEYGKRMKSLTAVASPCFFTAMQVFRPLLGMRMLLRPFVVVHQKFFTTVAAPLVYFFPGLLGDHILNPDNVPGPTMAFAAVNAIEDLPRELFLQFGSWIEQRKWGDQEHPYEDDLAKITAPLYCVGGPRDYFCPPKANEGVIERVSSKHTQYRMFAKKSGDLADYGHGDLIVGNDAPTEIFPSILDWIQRFD